MAGKEREWFFAAKSLEKQGKAQNKTPPPPNEPEKKADAQQWVDPRTSAVGIRLTLTIQP